MDSIVDCMEEVSNRFQVFEVKTIKPEAVVLAVMNLQSIKNWKPCSGTWQNSKEFNSNGTDNRGQSDRKRRDVVYRKALSTLSVKKDPIELIKWKHLYER